MMQDTIERRVARWDQSVQSGEINKFSLINRKIIYLSEKLFFDYEPHVGTKREFFARLGSWLDNMQDEEKQKLLFELVPKIFYIGREEMNLLYREAYITNYARWLIDTTQFDFISFGDSEVLNNLVADTWFYPLTDSLRINQFYHVNDIPGKHNYRPDWKSLVQFGDIEKIKDYIKKQEIKRIVLLEDFIGNGGQVSKAIQFAANNLSEIPILIIPLIICPAGIRNSKNLQSQYPNVVVDPVIIVKEEDLIHQNLFDNVSDFFKSIHPFIIDSYEQVSDSIIVDENKDPYGPFGWRNTGGLVVMHTNTPNNSLPLIHNLSNTWKPLFKRHKRI